MSDRVLQADGWTGRVAAIYARVSSERQRQDETIQRADSSERRNTTAVWRL
jgi:predicted site-specific integrase-resolvase